MTPVMRLRIILYAEVLSIAAVVVALIVVLTSRLGHSPHSPDLVVALPGQPTANFKQFAGYVEIETKPERALFYYLVEAEGNPAWKPLILWLAGGPGCSSLGVGAFFEHGPFRPSKDALVRNEYSWNKEANMLYLESPAGVGFSYSSDATFYQHITDEITALDNLVFLEKWVAKHPEYEHREFYIAGESYGGHTVPQLAMLVLKRALKLNFKGIMLGNPLLDFNTDFDYRADYMRAHGQISDQTYWQLQQVCNFSTMRREYHLHRNLSGPCTLLSNTVWNESGNSADPYSIGNGLCDATSLHAELYDDELGSLDLCLIFKVISYFERSDVKKALHGKVGQWSLCTNPTIVEFDKNDFVGSVMPLLRTLIRSTNISIMIYSGDQDSVLTFMGTRVLVDRLVEETNLQETKPYRPWFYGQKLGGWSRVYQKLSFATVKVGGHQPPYDAPELSLALLHWHLQAKPLPNKPDGQTVSWSNGNRAGFSCVWFIVFLMLS